MAVKRKRRGKRKKEGREEGEKGGRKKLLQPSSTR